MLERVNKDLAPMKAHYFLFNAGTGPIVPFLPTIAKQLGFSGSLVGTIYMVLPISGLIAKPLFGGLADRFGLHKAVFLLFQTVLVAGFLIIHFIPELELNAKVNFKCHSGATFIEVLMNNNTKHPWDYEYKEHTYTDCQLSCNGDQDVYKKLCDEWNVAQFCRYHHDTVPDNATYNFIARVNLYKTYMVGKHLLAAHVENITFSDGQPRIGICNNAIHSACIARCPEDAQLNKTLRDIQVRGLQGFAQISSYRYHLFLSSALISWIGMAVVVSIADTICFAILGEERRKDYGKQKMWGSIGFGLSGISAGYLVDVLSPNETYKDYTCIFYILLIAMIFDIIVSSILKTNNMSRSKDEPYVYRELGMMIKEPRVLVFAFWCIGAGMCTGVIWNFLFWYTEDIAPLSQRPWLKTMQGLLTGVQCFLGEMLFNFLSGNILKKLGHVNVMSLVLLVYAVRFMAYSIFTNLWVFLLLEILHGPSWGLCWPAMVSYGEKVAPHGTKATIQGLVGAIFEGIGVSMGSLLFGYLLDRYHGVTTFRIFSGGALAWLAVYWILQMVLRKVKSYPIHQGHNHLATYAPPEDALLVTTSQEMQTY